MKIAVQDIPSEGRSFVFHSRDWLPGEVETIGDCKAELQLRREGTRVLAEGSLALQVRKCCDRCLADFVMPVSGAFEIDFELTEDVQHAGREHGCSAEQMDTEYLAASEIDLHELLRQQYYLALPVKTICTENCKGLCSRCGTNLNSNECRCPQEPASAFGALRTLLK